MTGTTITEDAGVPDVAPPATAASVPRLEHQPALDGLRGLAVIAVFIFHQPLVPSWLQGGFLGVDLFFVLSGYLITSLLLVDFRATGRAVTRQFWARRARRLLPPLGVFLLLVATYAAFFAQPSERTTIRTAGIMVVLYVYNWWRNFWKLGAPSIYSHLWSLSIEEQFYLVWPLLLAGLLRWGRGRFARLFGGTVALIAGSIAIMWWRDVSELRSISYEATDSRAHSLLIGAALAIVVVYLGRPTSRAVLRLVDVAGLVAFGWIVFLAFNLSSGATWLYRGGFAAIALAAAVVIFAATGQGLLRTMLSLPPLRWVGLVSYGVYLYHIPIGMMLNKDHTGLTGAPLVLVHAVAVAAFAAASYFLVERPIRAWRGWPRTRFVVPALAAVTLVAFLAASTIHARKLTPTEFEGAMFAIEKAHAPNGAVRVLVVGDSLAQSLAIAGRPPYTSGRLSATVVASGCGILDGDVAVGSGFLPALPCWQPFAVRYNTALRSYDPAVVVLMFGPTLMYDRRLGRNVLRVGSPAFEQYLDDNLDSLRGQLKTQSLRFVVTTVPCMTANHYGTITNLDSVLRDNARRESVNGALRQYATSRHLALLDFDSLLCRGGQRVVLAHRYALGAANGIGLSPAGAGTSWRWLAHQLNLDQPLTPASRPS